MLTENICCNCRYYDGVKGVMGCALCSFGEEKKMVLWDNQCDAIWLIPERFKTGTPTNADRIRAMSDEELAAVITDDWCEIVCNGTYLCNDGTCEQHVLKWLKEEAGET